MIKKCKKCGKKLNSNNKIGYCIDCKQVAIFYCIKKHCSNVVYQWGCRCKSCARKDYIKKYHVRMNKENNPSWKGGLPICEKCGKQLSRYNVKRCRTCMGEIISNKLKIIYKNKKNHPRYHKKHSLVARRKISLAGGGTGIPYEYSEYGSDFDNALKEQVRFRDEYKCKNCGCSQIENGKQLDTHHIDYNKRNNNLQNLISLCRKCHMKTNRNRQYWSQFFIPLIYKVLSRRTQ